MNSLSWAIYAADVCQGLSIIFEMLGGLTVVVTGIASALSVIDGNGPVPHWKALLGAGMASLFVAAVLPSKETIYAIIASEYGDKLLHTQTAGKAEKALDAWLDKQ